jgi:hypothetical protein
MTGLPYGENADFNEMQSAAPLRATPDAGARTRNKSQSTGGSSPNLSLFQNTARPDEPVTAGASVGPGPGPMRNKRGYSYADSMQALSDATGDERLARLSMLLKQRGF